MRVISSALAWTCVALASSPALAQSGPPFIESFFEDTLGFGYYPGESALVPGETQTDGTIEVWAVDPVWEANGLGPRPAGSIKLLYANPVALFDTQQFNVTTAGAAATVTIDLESIACVYTVPGGSIVYLSGMVARQTFDFSAPSDDTGHLDIIHPTAIHSTPEGATTEAHSFATFDPAMPGGEPETTGAEAPASLCAAACMRDYIADCETARINFELARDNCSGYWQGGLAGCAVAGSVCSLVVPAGILTTPACCIIGAVAGAMAAHLDCLNDAQRSYNAALQIADTNYRLCMAGCGITVVYP